MVRKSAFLRTALYSGRYRPACRITHIGVLSTGSRLQARKNKSFFRFVTNASPYPICFEFFN
jgi:hypothetical protein